MIVYHGSTLCVENPLVGVCRDNLDFGKGFYLTDICEQAISWANLFIDGVQKLFQVFIQLIIRILNLPGVVLVHDSFVVTRIIGNRRKTHVQCFM